MTLQLEVGKKYLNRRGEVVEIVFDCGSHFTYRYEDIDGTRYADSGEYYKQEIHEEDLVSEYVEHSSTPIETTTKVPHIHKDLIIAWANGETIEIKNQITGEWYVPTDTPIFHEYYEYRIKPEKKVKQTYALITPSGALDTDDEEKCNVRFTFEDGKLIKAEVLR